MIAEDLVLVMKWLVMVLETVLWNTDIPDEVNNQQCTEEDSQQIRQPYYLLLVQKEM